MLRLSHLGLGIFIFQDMVFDGSASPYCLRSNKPWREYGRQKLEAEKQVLKVSDRSGSFTHYPAKRE